jgi:hypothetical protein
MESGSGGEPDCPSSADLHVTDKLRAQARANVVAVDQPGIGQTASRTRTIDGTALVWREDPG